MENTRNIFLKHLDALEKLRVEKDEIGLAIIKNPFEKLTAYLHDVHCKCSNEYIECRHHDGWETDTENLLEEMEILLEGPTLITVSGKRKIQIED